MTSAQLVNLKGQNVGEVTLNDTVFGIEPNSAVLFEALKRQLANARAGTAKAKTRAEVSGGGRKPWRQKGTGRARAGSIRSPLWAGGGAAFGPKPRDYTMAMPKKVRRLALKSALAARKDVLVVLKDLSELKEAKTKEIATALKALGLAEKKVLLVLDFACESCISAERAARNIALVKVVHINDLNVKDLLECEAVLTTERTLEAIANRFTAEPKTEKKEKGSAGKVAAEPKAKAEPKARAAQPKPAARAEVKDEAAGAGPEKARAARKKAADEVSGEEKPKTKKKVKEADQ